MGFRAEEGFVKGLDMNMMMRNKEGEKQEEKRKKGN